MRKRSDERALKEIEQLFLEAKNKARVNQAAARRYVARARKLAKRGNISLKPYRRLFCKACNSYFTSENSQLRIKKGLKTIKCLECGSYRRYKI